MTHMERRKKILKNYNILVRFKMVKECWSKHFPGDILSNFFSDRIIWNHLDPFGDNWIHLKAFGAIWSQFEPFGASWNHLEPLGAI